MIPDLTMPQAIFYSSIALASSIAVAISGYAAAKGEMAIGAAAVGVMAEDEKFFGKGLLMTVIPESIAIFGLVVALILLFVFAAI